MVGYNNGVRAGTAHRFDPMATTFDNEEVIDSTPVLRFYHVSFNDENAMDNQLDSDDEKMIDPTHVLRFLYLANRLDLYPHIEYKEQAFIIHYTNDSNNKIVISENPPTEFDRDWERDYLFAELERLTYEWEQKQKGSEDDERQEALSKLSDREKELLGLL